MVEIPTHGSTDQPASNLIPKGRYELEVIALTSYTTKSKFKAAVIVSLLLDGKFKSSDLMVVEEGSDWRWKQFLYAIGVRRKLARGEKVFNVTDEDVIGKKAFCDVIVDEEDPENPRNRISRYIPSDKKDVPASGVKPEPSVKETPKKQPEQKKKPEEKKEPEQTSDLGGEAQSSDFEEPPATPAEETQQTEKQTEDEDIEI